MERMGAASADICAQTPRLSKICREPLPSAVVRSSKLGCAAESAGTLSMSSVRSFVLRSASAKLAPTIPPPTMTTSHSCIVISGHRGHESLDGHGLLRHAVGEHLAAVARHDHVVFDADAGALEFSRDSRRTVGNVDARLDGEPHAGFEHAPLVADLVVTHVMHVHAQPMAGAVHEEFPVGAGLLELGHAALEQ